tara:strand:- start:287 stop:601 length:315 start_codon:yes stop_codon:yes gene_type:complete
MARKKKNKPEPKTHNGYTVGQEVFFICLSDSKIGYGRICDFYLDCTDADNPGEKVDCVSIVCYMRGSFQTTYMRDIIDEPSRRQVEQRDAAMASLGRSIRQKRK